VNLPAAELKERDFATQVYDMLRAAGFRRYHTYRSKRSPPGYPDESCWREGDRHLWLELKTERGKLSPAQKQTIRTMLAAGDEVYVVRPTDIEDLWPVLRTRGRVFDGHAFDAQQRLVARTSAALEASG